MNTLEWDEKEKVDDVPQNNKYKTIVYYEGSPESRYSGTMSVINTKFYLFGGKNSEKIQRHVNFSY